MIDVRDLLEGLASERPVFHSEAEFQHALAWRIHQTHPGAQIRPEYKPFPEERVYIDIWVAGTERAAIELKYFTRRFNVDVNGECFVLKDQSAQDIGRYDALKDVQRLERVVSAIPGCVGHAIVLASIATPGHA